MQPSDPVVIEVILLDDDRPAGNEVGEELPRHPVAHGPMLGQVDEENLDRTALPLMGTDVAGVNLDQAGVASDVLFELRPERLTGWCALGEEDAACPLLDLEAVERVNDLLAGHPMPPRVAAKAIGQRQRGASEEAASVDDDACSTVVILGQVTE